MSQKRVAFVLASLVGTMTISAGVLLLMEGGALGTSVPNVAFAQDFGAGVSAVPAASPALVARLKPTAAPLQPARWNYIIIYESGDVAASAQTLADGHLSGGSDPRSTPVRPQGNFHFVIDSPSTMNGMFDGTLEVGSTWNQQRTGAPFALWPDNRSHSYTPYNNAIGICLSADLSRTPISEAQHQTLVQVVRELQRQLDIPLDHILFQWDAGLKARTATAEQQAYDQRFRSQLN